MKGRGFLYHGAFGSKEKAKKRAAKIKYAFVKRRRAKRGHKPRFLVVTRWIANGTKK